LIPFSFRICPSLNGKKVMLVIVVSIIVNIWFYIKGNIESMYNYLI